MQCNLLQFLCQDSSKNVLPVLVILPLDSFLVVLQLFVLDDVVALKYCQQC